MTKCTKTIYFTSSSTAEIEEPQLFYCYGCSEWYLKRHMECYSINNGFDEICDDCDKAAICDECGSLKQDDDNVDMLWTATRDSLYVCYCCVDCKGPNDNKVMKK